MMFRTETRTRQVPVTHDGITQMVPEPYKVEVPVPPRDVPALVKRVMFRMAVGITVLAVALSVAAIGGLLARLVTPFVAYPAAMVLDALWIYAVMGEWESRYDPRTARWAQFAGAAFVALSMAAIVVYGALLGELAAGIIAALIPLGSKAAWVLRFKLTVRRLDTKNQAWLDQTRNDIYARKALAEEMRTLDEARRVTAELDAERAPEAAELEQGAQPEPLSLAEPVAQVVASVQVAPAEPELSPAQPREPFGFSAATVQRVERTAQVAELLKAEPRLTGAQVAERLDVSLASAKRYLADARKEVSK
ncbi:hypothetical protein [Streptomyces sp. NBC_01092]|uniref:hypothetical protein n=1 Tax=Streptomyces sp. NBC_01092 TaxID=2903748 RepID=UPI003866F4D6|nr:hypothetical protein OG254_38070 [Streptomyces sp. NBC_01092]